MCEKPNKKVNPKLIHQNNILKDECELIFEGEENFFGESINTPEEFIEDIHYLIDMVYKAAMEEEEEMNQLAYLIGYLIGLKSKLNRVCQKT